MGCTCPNFIVSNIKINRCLLEDIISIFEMVSIVSLSFLIKWLATLTKKV
jgi:hypothetical protein